MRSQRVVWRVLALAGVLIALVQFVRSWRYVRGAKDSMYDFNVYYDAVQWVRSGRSLYSFATESGLGFTYPPFAEVVFRPLGYLPHDVAAQLWTASNIAVLASLAWMLTVCWLPLLSTPQRLLAWGVIAALMAETILVRTNLYFGQISMMLAALSAAETGKFLKSPRWGALTGVAAAIKLTPGLFGVLHLLAERRRFLWSLGVGCVATLIGALFLPHDFIDYVTRALWDTNRIGDLNVFANVTWTGLLISLGISGPVRTVLALVLAVVTAVTALWNARRHWDSTPMASAAIIGSASVLVPPISWPHHAIWLVIWCVGGLLVGRTWLRITSSLVLVGLIAWAPLVAFATSLDSPRAPYVLITLSLALAVTASLRAPNRT